MTNFNRHTGSRWLLLLIHLGSSFNTAASLVLPHNGSTKNDAFLSQSSKLLLRSQQRSLSASASSLSLEEGDNDTSRRLFLTTLSSASLLAALLVPVPASAATKRRLGIPKSRLSNLKCLLDLPPVTKDCVRVYLCRHGQTELNRLHQVQGARIDPSLNGTGRQMAERIGQSVQLLRRQNLSQNLSSDNDCDKISDVQWRHSPMMRAQETAVLALQASEPPPPIPDLAVKDGDVIPAVVTVKEAVVDPVIQPIPSLGEVDFGSKIEGKDSKEVKAKMAGVFAAWAVGKIDERGEGGGESAREIYQRVAASLRALSQVGEDSRATATTSVVAVSHSTLLRALLSVTMDISLMETVAPVLEQKNGCINVLDINIRGKTTTRKYGNKLGNRVTIEFPTTKVIRVNEIRHLTGLLPKM